MYTRYILKLKLFVATSKFRLLFKLHKKEPLAIFLQICLILLVKNNKNILKIVFHKVSHNNCRNNITALTFIQTLNFFQ